MPAIPADRRSGTADVFLAALAYLLLAVYVTWPLARHVGDHLYGIDPVRWSSAAPLGMADHFLNLWILSWTSHALRHAPGSLFDANIFHPMPESLATGEHLLGAVPWYAPLWAATGNPIAAANGLVFVSFVLGGLGMYLLVRDVTDRRGAAFVAGVIFAFAPWRFTWLVHLQLVGVHALPFVVFFLRRALERGGASSLVGFSVALLLQALTSYYLAYICAVLCAGVLLWIASHKPRSWRRLGAVLIAGGAAAVVVGLVSRPYLRLASSGVLPSGPESQALDWLQVASAQPQEFLVRGSPQYAGLVAVVLAVAGMALGGKRLWRIRLLFLWAMASGIVLSLGPVLGGHRLPYTWLASWLPGFSTMRVPERFIILATLGVAGLAGIGTACAQNLVTSRLPSHAARTAATGIVTGLVLLALLVDWVPREMRLSLRRFPTLGEVPPVYRWLAEHGTGLPLLEIPARRGGFAGAESQARAQYHSVLHWLPLLGGYNGYQPPFVDLYAELGHRLPAADALQTLVNVVDVGWVLVHTRELDPAARRAWDERPAGLEHAASFGDDVIFRVVRAPTEDWRAHLRGLGPAATTFAGLPIRPVPVDGRQAIVDVDLPSRALHPRQAMSVTARVTNPTTVRWPCFAAGTEGVVLLWARWMTSAGTAIGRPASTRIPRDLGPGERVAVTLVTWAPAEEGGHTLELSVGQGLPDDTLSWRAGQEVVELEIASPQ